MAQQSRGGWRRKFNRYVALATAIVGVAIVLSSFLFLQDLLWWYVTVALGLIVALTGFVYGVYPFLTSERQYPALREEVDRFIGLVRRMNTAAVSRSNPDLENVKAEMVAAVERMVDLAGKPG